MKITQYIKVITDNLVLNEDNLNKLDASIGDGDHGSNIVRGFQAILSQVSNFTNESLIEKDLMICAQQLMSKVGGSSGPILGTAFMALATVLKGKTKIVNEDLANALETAYTRMCQLGKSKIGEKTMLDALYPTIAALKTTPEILDFTKAAVAAKDGAEATIKMLATKGRASYLGERSIGHMDPGACSVAIIFSALAKINQMTPEENKNDSLKSEVHNQNETNKYSLLPITKNVSILMISHSLALAKAMWEFANEMKTADFAFAYVAGIEQGKSFGTNPYEIKETIQKLATDAEVLIIYDLGSSKMNAEMAINLIPEYATRIKIANCAFLEGIMIAVSSNNTNSAKELCEIVESQAKINK